MEEIYMLLSCCCLIIFVYLQVVNAATFSMAFFKLQEENISLSVQVNSDYSNFDNVTSGQYYNFNYNIGEYLEVRVPFDGSNSGYYLIKNGPDGTGKTVYDSRVMTFMIMNKCPSSEISCNIEMAAFEENLFGAHVDVYVNNAIIRENFNRGSFTFTVEPDDVIKVIVSGTPSTPFISLIFKFYNVEQDQGEIVYGRVYWYYDNLVTDAVIETVGVTAPRDGSVFTSGGSIDMYLTSSPLIPSPSSSTSYNIQLSCDNLPPVTQIISSNSVVPQAFTIPAGYSSMRCLLSVIDSLSGVNTVEIIIALNNSEIIEFTRSLWSSSWITGY